MIVYVICRLMIEYMKNPDDPTWRGYFYACLLFIAAIMQSLVLQHYFHRCFVFGMHLKTAIITIVYSKVRNLYYTTQQEFVSVYFEAR